MIVILLIGIAGLGVLIERFYAIVLRSKTASRPFIERVIEVVRAGRVDEAIGISASSSATLPDVALVILRTRSHDEGELRGIAAAVTLAVVPRLNRRLQYLPAFGAAAIMFGTFFAIGSIHETLMAFAPGAGARLAAGIATALEPLGAAFGVAAVLVIGRSYLAGQAEAIAEDARELSARLINALVDRPDVRLGHR